MVEYAVVSLSAFRRIGWSAGSQVASSGSNLAFSIIVARSIDTSLLGVFSLLLAIFNIGIGIQRGFTAEPLIFREATVSKLPSGPRQSSALNASALLAIVLSALFIPLGLALMVDVKTMLIFAAMTPVALLQDTVRFALNDLGRSRAAFGIEVAWISVQIPLMVALGSGELNRLIAFWGIGALCSCAIGLAVLKVSPSVTSGLAWLKSSRKIGVVYCTDFAVSSGINQVSVLILVLMAGYGAAGELRAAQILLTPLMVFTLGASFALGPESARLRKAGNLRALRKLPWIYALGVGIFGLVSVAAIEIAPTPVLEFLMGESAESGASLAPLAAAAICLMGMSVGSGLVLRAIGRVGQSVVAKAVIAPITLMSVGLGSWLAGAAGSQIGLSAGNSLRVAASAILVRVNLSKISKGEL
ncbi:hypothetical protein O4160_08595 [Rhodococcus sp. IEGM 1401]|uniref:hypothetical protein n=1 Tax=unclassified Rhodococcus (in: high G+C Gram-positive bacteria) TaxID=192944 RepID=UPI0022B51B0F|nr:MULTISPECIES: hypothetical protein [unclassified Rhodococcus (in: high G+C Gram-positive bacteria)]MCZ4560900.1 hypothetical protein [Rhodococcus sp. IEGM 1401]MDI9921041.1 hypothetical protein [Rhodococcus sp. IEGM 1372]MDV8033359.1 hypothetical protein [Rhodococcus sp. IEGM 1414]